LIKGIIFDVDGTLVQLKVDPVKMRTTMIEVLRKRGFDVSSLNFSSFTQTILDTATAQIRTGKVDQDEGELRDHLYSVLDKLELEWNSESAPIDGIEQTLKKLGDASLKLGVVTNSGRVPAVVLLTRHDLQRHFDCILTRDDVSSMKPDPEGILKAINILELPKESVIYVGDSGIDVRAAKAAGIRMAAVTSGFYTEERLKQEGSDYVLRSVNDLFGIL
jgi:HAD superfamily hydrolase (TIGR01509 family)